MFDKMKYADARHPLVTVVLLGLIVGPVPAGMSRTEVQNITEAFEERGCHGKNYAASRSSRSSRRVIHSVTWPPGSARTLTRITSTARRAGD